MHNLALANLYDEMNDTRIKSLDCAVVILESEYGITNARDKKPILITAEISRCTGVLLYDSNTKVGSLLHLYFAESFFQSVLEVIGQTKWFNGNFFDGYIIRTEKDDKLNNDICKAEEILCNNNILKRPFGFVNEESAAFDSRDGKFYEITKEQRSGMYLRDSKVYSLSSQFKNLKNIRCCYTPYIHVGSS